MKKNRLTIIVFIALAAVASWLWLNRSSSTIKGVLRDFAFADTAAVDKIFLADKDGRQVTLVRKDDNSWTVNNKFIARKDAIDNLLYTIKAVEVRSPVGKNLYNNTMKLMSAKSVKVEIYANGELAKTYYVGHPTMDNLGTFMYLEGSTVPFITHIPGFNGFLSTRYFASEAEWRDKSIFRFDPRKIVKVEVVDYKRPIRSFVLSREPDSSYSIIKTSDSQPLMTRDVNKVRAFLSAFQATYFERLDNDISKFQKDSVITAGPFARVTVKLDDGTIKGITCYRKPVTTASRMQIDEVGKDLPFDYDRFYAEMTSDTSLLICQYFHFDRILKDPRNFMPGKDLVPAEERFK